MELRRTSRMAAVAVAAFVMVLAGATPALADTVAVTVNVEGCEPVHLDVPGSTPGALVMTLANLGLSENCLGEVITRLEHDGIEVGATTTIGTFGAHVDLLGL